MSEKKLSDILQEKITTLEQKIAALETPPQPSSTTSTELVNLHTHTPKEMFDCPTCGGPYLQEAEKRLTPQITKQVLDKVKKGEYVTCDDCGELVEKEAEECPTCHGKHAH